MKTQGIKYLNTKRYKYRLAEDAEVPTSILGYTIKTKHIELSPDGFLLVRAGYSWDGPSGPSIDTKTFMRSSLFHDAGYQFIRIYKLPLHCKPDLDQLMQEVCLADGMIRFRAWYVHRFVSFFGYTSCIPGSQKPDTIYEAP